MWKIFSVLAVFLCASTSFGQPSTEKADARDLTVLQATLTNLLSNSQMPVFLKGKNPRTEVVVLDQTPDVLPPPKQEVEKETRRTLNDEEYLNLISRNSTPQNHARRVSWADFQPGPKIIFHSGKEPTDDEFASKYPNGRGWVQLWLPGYSADGNRAIVTGRKGPAPHGAALVAALEKKEETWTITWIKITYWR